MIDIEEVSERIYRLGTPVAGLSTGVGLHPQECFERPRSQGLCAVTEQTLGRAKDHS